MSTGTTSTQSLAQTPSGDRVYEDALGVITVAAGQSRVLDLSDDVHFWRFSQSTDEQLEVKIGDDYVPLAQSGYGWIGYDAVNNTLSVSPPAGQSQQVEMRIAGMTSSGDDIHLSLTLDVKDQAGLAAADTQGEAYWYTYDHNNRVLIDGGVLDNGQITLGDKGQRIR